MNKYTNIQIYLLLCSGKRYVYRFFCTPCAVHFLFALLQSCVRWHTSNVEFIKN